MIKAVYATFINLTSVDKSRKKRLTRPFIFGQRLKLKWFPYSPEKEKIIGDHIKWKALKPCHGLREIKWDKRTIDLYRKENCPKKTADYSAYSSVRELSGAI